ncbi:hypothetical protein [Streptomyces hundungensis]|uniref:hypothetical protein n=1 Tax=Streptomyces hundungensis TaxID=1077946 RepID=UPI0033F65924
MDDLDAPLADDYLDEPRLPLLTLTEARDAVRLLQHLANREDGDTAHEARQLAGDLAYRLPSP